MKKKLLALVLAFTTVFTLAACSAPTGGTSSGDESASAVYESADVQRDASGNPVKPKYDALKCVKLGKYMGVNVTATKYEATKDDVDSYINNILQSKAEYADSDKTQVESGDMVNIDYTGTVDGEEFSGGSATDQDLTIGSGTYIEGFEDQLVGANVGDTVTVNVTFPDDYSNTELAGKDAQFEVTINSIKSDQKVVPDYTDDFVNEYTNGQYTTTDEFTAYIWKVLQQQAASQTEQDLSSKLQEAVYNVCKVKKTPKGLLAYYQVYYRSQDENAAKQQGISFDDYISQVYGFRSEDAYMEALNKQLEDNVIPHSLIIEAIIEKEKIQADDDSINAFLKEYASYYGYDDVDTMLERNGFSSVDAFEQAVGKDSFEQAVKQYKMWQTLRDAANIAYVDESGNATESGSASS